MLIEEMTALVDAGEVKAWVPRAFKEVAQRRPLHVVGTRGLPWTEIDFPEDYRRAVEVVLPQIESDLSSTAAAPLFRRVARSA
jgi:choline kinase